MCDETDSQIMSASSPQGLEYPASGSVWARVCLACMLTIDCRVHWSVTTARTWRACSCRLCRPAALTPRGCGSWRDAPAGSRWRSHCSALPWSHRCATTCAFQHPTHPIRAFTADVCLQESTGMSLYVFVLFAGARGRCRGPPTPNVSHATSHSSHSNTHSV